MSDANTKWLVEGASWLKYTVETRLLDKKSDATLVVKDKSIGTVINRLKDNTVGIPALKTGKLVYTRTGNAFWDLYFLADIGLKAKDIGIEKEVAELFKLQLADGSFIIMDGAKPGYHCIPTIILSPLAKMGYKDDPHILKFLQNVIDLQRLDGGWHCALSRAKGKRLQDSVSCPMDNLNVLMLLGQYEEYRKDNRFNVAIDLLLAHWHRYPRASSWFFTIQASLDLKLGKNNLKNEMNTSPLHSPTCKHVVLCPSGFQ